MLALSILFHWKLVLTNQYTWLESGDIGSLILPWFQFQAGEWHAGRFPLWDPYSWAGQPLFGQAQPGAAYPLNWLLFWMPLDHGWMRQDVLHWWYVLVHYCAGLSAYALIRDLGRSRAAAVLGGVIYSLGGYVASIDSPQMLQGAVWAPLAVLFVLRAERGERPMRNALLGGFFLGVSWLVGHHQMQLFLSLAIAGIWIVIAARQGMMKIARVAAACFLMTAATSAFQTIPAAEYARLAVRWVGADQPQGLHETVPYPVHAQYAMKPLGLLGIFVSGIEQHPYNAFVGVAALALAILGALAFWRERYVRWLAVMAIGAVLFALGGNSVIHGMFYALIPMIEKARVPEAASAIFALGLAPLAAFGLDALREGRHEFSRRASQILSAFGAVLAFGALFFYAAKGASATGDGRVILTSLCAFFAAALFTMWRAGAVSMRVGSALALALVLFELGTVTDSQLATADRAKHPYLYQLADNYDVASFVKGSRFSYDSKAIPYNIGDWYGIEAFNAYAASVPEALWRQQAFAWQTQDALGIRYYLGPAPQRPDQRKVFEGRGGMNVFENPGAFPRVWAVHSSAPADDLSLAAPNIDLKHKVFVASPPTMDACDGDEVWMPHHGPNEITIRANMACRGMVILSDSWYPGWEATVDGRSAPIEKADWALRGVVVPAGDHTIEMRYRPWSVFGGGALTLASALIALLCAFKRP